MNSIALGLICFGCVSGGTFFGFYLSRSLPVHHLSTESKDAIKMAWGIVATMAALVLSLLLSSAKVSFDTINAETTEAGARIIVLDQVLDRYGPESKPVREELRTEVATRIQSIWPDAKIVVPASVTLTKGKGMRVLQDKLSELTPANDNQRALLAQAQQITGDLVMARWLVIEQSRTFLPSVFYGILVFWITMLFIGIGLFAPANKTVLIALFLCNFSLSAAVFLIEEMSHPLDGMVKVSSAPMQEALEYLNQP